MAFSTVPIEVDADKQDYKNTFDTIYARMQEIEAGAATYDNTQLRSAMSDLARATQKIMAVVRDRL